MESPPERFDIDVSRSRGRIEGSLESDDFLERLASIEDERWSDWQAYLHSQCIEADDGILIILAEMVRRWTIQMNSPYEGLNETDRQSDRHQVRRYLPLIVELLGKQQKLSRIKQWTPIGVHCKLFDPLEH